MEVDGIVPRKSITFLYEQGVWGFPLPCDVFVGVYTLVRQGSVCFCPAAIRVHAECRKMILVWNVDS